MRKNIFITGIFIISVIVVSCMGNEQITSDDTTVKASTIKTGQAFVQDDVSDKNILQIAIGSADHSTLVAAVQAAEIENVLANNGPLTVFAPTNAAFEKLPAGTVENLLKPENKNDLIRIITFHASPGTYKDKTLKDGMKLFQATGDYVDVEIKDDGTYVHGIKILATIDASNGVIHVVDDVMLPPSK